MPRSTARPVIFYFVAFLGSLLVPDRGASQSINSGSVRVQEIARTATTITLQIDLPAPQFDTDARGEAHLRLLREQVRNGDPLAPLGFALRVSKQSAVQILSQDVRARDIRGLITTIGPVTDISVDGAGVHKPVSTKDYARHDGIGTASLRYVGRLRSTEICELTVGAFDPTANGLRFIKRIVVRITEPQHASSLPVTDLTEPYRISTSTLRARQAEARIGKSRLTQSSSDDVQQLPGIRAEDGMVYRMYVRKTGVYRLTFEDLKQFGIDPSKIDPTTLRLINKYQQVPIYIFDHQDGHLDPNDYIEFFGEEKLHDGPGVFGDFHFDPDTKDNVYFLVWGSTYSPIPAGGLKRIVEESGEIRTSDKSQYTDLKDASFPSLIHFEQNSVLPEDLEIVDPSQLSNIRDHYFMKDLENGASVAFQTIVPYPDVRSNRPISLRVAMHGITRLDPGSTNPKGIELPDVPNEHEAEISINNQALLHGIWDSQVMKFLSTDTLSQLLSPVPTAALLAGPRAENGINLPISITIANRKMSAIRTVFAVNWFELGYDRLYEAFNDELTFHAPKGSVDGLYQFTLQNFNRTDISIYRKGVSRISNVVISSAADASGAVHGKAVFQLHVSSDADEFIAVLDSNKLKPSRYRRDDFLGLRDPSNRGSYVIITSREHLAKTNPNASVIPLQKLLEYRTTTNSVTGKLIDVANIYDEFNAGARSPEAIKAFLKYAYVNWAEPPKYVLLVGVTHSGTDDPQIYAPNDQVPAPYVQAFQEGPVAADPWYAMIDGDDIVPDLLIGRLPTADINQDVQYVDKVLQYERDPLPDGAWKNRAFFIAADIEFSNQVEDLLTNYVPHRITGLRMSARRELPYYGTDQTLVDKFNQGIGSIVYLGHGGNAIWADQLDSTGREIMNNFDMPRLKNDGRYPIIMSLTCFTGGYDRTQGLLSTLLTTPHAGAIAGFGTTGFGWAINDWHMAQAVLPSLYDSIGGTFAERVQNGKIAFLLRGFAGDLIPQTLMFAYHYLGDPLLSPYSATERVTLTLASRNLQPGGPIAITGRTTLQSGTAHLEVVDVAYSQLQPTPWAVDVPISNGGFSFSGAAPNTSMPYGAIRATVSDNSDGRYGSTYEDITFTSDRLSELRFDPYPIPSGSAVSLQVAAQSAQSVTSIQGVVNIYTHDGAGVVSQRTVTRAMTLNGDRYELQLAASELSNGDRLVAHVEMTTASGVTTSDSITASVGAAADPSAYHDVHHPSLVGKFRGGPAGLVWTQQVYNWGSADAAGFDVHLIDQTHQQVLGNATVPGVAARQGAWVAIPFNSSTLDSGSIVAAITPHAGTSPLNLRDSIVMNDTTYAYTTALAFAAYRRPTGTTTNGAANSRYTFSGGEVELQLSPGAEGNIESDVVRLNRSFTKPSTTQPDIQFVPLRSEHGKQYWGLDVLSDSLGAIPLSQTSQPSTVAIRIDPTDSVTAAHSDLHIYRFDARSHLWTILQTDRSGPDKLRATITNLGTFAVAYHTDTRQPVVDIAIEGQVFSNRGEVPPHPHVHAVMQDANGIEVTPGKTIVKVDGRTLEPSEYVLLDSGRSTTTVNLRLEPSLSDGDHTISIQATDNNGLTNTPAKELSVHVSKEFGVSTLGSYPNPFTKDYMFLAYEIRGVAFAELVGLDIYTVSGRRIRTVEFPSDDPTRTFGFFKGGTGVPTSLGYHEIWWDGRDDDGNEVANGVYFYRLRVKTKDDAREVTGKFARVR